MNNKIENEEWINSWRGLLIIAIVVFHLFGVGAIYSIGLIHDFYEGANRLFGQFHTISFFVLAAVTWKTRDISYCEFVTKKFKRLMIPYYVFAIASMIIFIGIGSVIMKNPEGNYDSYQILSWWQPIVSILHAGEWPNNVGLKCNQVLWFLPCMFMSVVSYFALDRLIKNKWWQLASVIILALIVKCIALYGIRMSPFGIHKVPRNLIFMILGRCFISVKPYELVKSHKIITGILAITFFAIVYVLRLNWIQISNSTECPPPY